MSLPLPQKPGHQDWTYYFKRDLPTPSPERTAPFLTHFRDKEEVRLLDFGCGNMRWTSAMHRDRGQHNIGSLTIDMVDKHIDLADGEPGGPGQKIKADFRDVKLESRAYDGIMARHSIMYQEPECMMQSLGKLADALKEDGVLYFTVPRHGHVARENNLVCMNHEAIEETVKKLGLELISDTVNDDETIGAKKLLVPMHHVHARKPKQTKQ